MSQRVLRDGPRKEILREITPRNVFNVAVAVRNRMDSARQRVYIAHYIAALRRHMDRIGLEDTSLDALYALATTIDWNSEIPPF